MLSVQKVYNSERSEESLKLITKLHDHQLELKNKSKVFEDKDDMDDWTCYCVSLPEGCKSGFHEE